MLPILPSEGLSFSPSYHLFFLDYVMYSLIWALVRFTSHYLKNVFFFMASKRDSFWFRFSSATRLYDLLVVLISEPLHCLFFWFFWVNGAAWQKAWFSTVDLCSPCFLMQIIKLALNDPDFVRAFCVSALLLCTMTNTAAAHAFVWEYPDFK